ncbi:MAG: PH domain-containing protein [Marmoricola sp.]
MAISSKLLNSGESVVISTRTHPKALILPVLVLIVVGALAGYLTSLVDAQAGLIAIWVVAAALLVWFTVRPFLRWLTSTYTITSRRLITRHGIVTRTGHDIPLNRISDVSYERGVLDRMLGCGTLVISDASETGSVSLPDVPKVEQTQLKLSGLLYDLNSPQHDDGT